MELSRTDNLLLNMTAGLLPEHLKQEEVKLLIERFGENWFYALGYDDSYKKPSID